MGYDAGYIPKLLWHAGTGQWTAANLRAESAEPMPWPGWLNAADFPTPRYRPSQAVRFRVGGRWRRGRVVSAAMSGGNRMAGKGEDLQQLSRVWGQSGEVQYAIQGDDGALYRDVPQLRVRDPSDR